MTGNRSFRNIILAIVNCSNSVILVFDRTNRASFEGIEFWIEDLKNQAQPNAIFFLLGNKSDLEPVISMDEAQEMAEKYGLKYIETSAKNNDQISMVFELIIREIILLG